MAKEPFVVSALDAGQVTNVSPKLLDHSRGYTRDLRNLDLEAQGIIRKRPGVGAVLDPVAAAITGAHEFVKLSTGAIQKIVSHGTVVQRWTGSAWTSIRTGLTSGAEHDFLTFADSMLLVNGTEASASWSGSALTTPAGFPVASYLTEFRRRVVAAGIPTAPTLIHMSHTGDATVWDPDAVGSNAVKVFIPDDGEDITGLLAVGENGILVGKENHLYSLSGYTRNDFTINLLDPAIGVGSHKSMVYIRPNGYWVNRLGIFRAGLGGDAEWLSQPLQDLFDTNVDKLNISRARGMRYRRYYVVTLPYTDGTSVTWAYHVDRGTWAPWPGVTIRQRMAVSDDSLSDFYYSEPSGVQLYRLLRDTHSDKGGTAIEARHETWPLDMNQPSVDKEFFDLYITVLVDSAQYSLVAAINPDDTGWVERTPVTITGTAGSLQVVRVPLQVTARFLAVRISNNSAGEDFKPLAYEFIFERKGVL